MKRRPRKRSDAGETPPWRGNLEPAPGGIVRVHLQGARYYLNGIDMAEHCRTTKPASRRDPTIGRFIQPDTIIPGGSASQSLNRYSYVFNSPTNGTDPSGNEPNWKLRKLRAGYGHYWKQYSRAWHRGGKLPDLQLRPETSDTSEPIMESDSAPAPEQIFVCDPPGTTNDTLHYFPGYSAWEEKILLDLLSNGGSEAIHGVAYIISHHVHITIRSSWKSMNGRTGAWFEEGENLVVLSGDLKKDDGSPRFTLDEEPDKGGLSLVIHEALHLEQGFWLSHSWEGERLAWRTQAHVLDSLGGWGYGEDMAHAMKTEDAYSFAAGLLVDNPGYARLMILGYPPYPIGR